jgi:uncharacterized protein VirK/YbjX
MIQERKKVAIWRAIYFKILNVYLKNIIKHIPILSVAINGWQFASLAFADSTKGYRRKQQWKSFYGALINPRFASKWFKILNSPDLLQVVPYRDRLYLKPFRVYMSIRWTKKQKIKVILDTYRFILSKGEEFKQVISRSSNIEITRFKLNDTMEFYLNLGYDERYRKEGELVFSFECDQLGGLIAAAAFSFEEIETGRWVSRIACIQGLKTNDLNSPKIAQKLLHGLRPKSLIVFIVQEFSRQLGLTAVYGAGDAIQAYRRKHAIHLQWWHAIQFDYDALWSESGGQRKSDGWYELPLIPVRKSIQEIKTNKRALYFRRYSFLDDLSMKIAEAVKRFVD